MFAPVRETLNKGCARSERLQRTGLRNRTSTAVVPLCLCPDSPQKLGESQERTPAIRIVNFRLSEPELNEVDQRPVGSSQSTMGAIRS